MAFRSFLRAVFSIASAVMIGNCALAQSMVVAEISVCDLFRDLNRYSGKVVAVRGINNRRGALVASDSCSVTFFAGGGEWPLAVYIVSPKRYLDRYWHLFEYEIETEDGDSLRRLSAVAKDLAPDETFEATYIGVLLVRDHYVVVRNKDGTPVQTNGFGHLGGCPAALVRWKVQDIKVVKLPAKLRRSAEPPPR